MTREEMFTAVKGHIQRIVEGTAGKTITEDMSMTARTSSIRASRVGTSRSRSDRPIPRLSNMCTAVPITAVRIRLMGEPATRHRE